MSAKKCGAIAHQIFHLFGNGPVFVGQEDIILPPKRSNAQRLKRERVRSSGGGQIVQLLVQDQGLHGMQIHQAVDFPRKAAGIGQVHLDQGYQGQLLDHLIGRQRQRLVDQGRPLRQDGIGIRRILRNQKIVLRQVARLNLRKGSEPGVQDGGVGIG